MSLAGRWEGEFAYPEGIEDPSVSFEMIVSWGFRGRVSGKIVDRDATARTAKMHGRYRGSQLLFFKTYDRYYVLGEDGVPLEFDKFMLEQHGVEVYRKPRHVVRYYAMWNAEQQRYHGIWQIPNQAVPTSGGPVETGTARGTFSMWRTSWEVPRPW